MHSGNRPFVSFPFVGLQAFRRTDVFLLTLLLAATDMPPSFAQGLPGGGIAPITPPSSTILPTDVLPLPQVQNRLTFAENLQLRILQKLPSRFYFSSSVETSFRLETNPFQFPIKRVLLNKLFPNGTQTFPLLNAQQQYTILQTIRSADQLNGVFRVLPNVTAGFTLNPHWRVYGNFFTIRDSLTQSVRLNTNIYSYSFGTQHDFPLGRRGNLQADISFRELNQMHQHSVFDVLPSMTASFVMTPRTVAFVNALFQIRGRKYFQPGTRELDPFYTAGFLYQRNGWALSVSTTFVQNFRQPFNQNAVIPVNNYASISDFEIARRIVRQLPGLQAFMRAEPIFNMHSHNHPGLAGTDFRMFWGLRFAMAKPSLTAGLEQLKQQIQEQEAEPPKPAPEDVKPSAFLLPSEIIASRTQPMHGLLPLPDLQPASEASDVVAFKTIMPRATERVTPEVNVAAQASPPVPLSEPVLVADIVPSEQQLAQAQSVVDKSTATGASSAEAPTAPEQAQVRNTNSEMQFIVHAQRPTATENETAQANGPVIFFKM